MKILAKIFCLFFIIFIIQCGGKKEEEVEQVNTAPFIRKAIILPENPVLGSRITLRIEAGDNEGDKIIYTVKWFLNDEEIGEGIEFYLDEAKDGDRIFAKITPDDGKLTGETVTTSVVTIGNTPPKITSAKITPDAILTSTDNLTVLGEGFDPDGDSLRWLCYWVLDYSERIADSSTVLNLRRLRLKKGSHLTAELYAYDGDTVSMPYLLEIDVVNSHPVVKEGVDSMPYRPESLYYELPIIDPDGDPLTFEILSAPEGVSIKEETGIIYGTVLDTTSFEILVRATDSDGAYLEAKFTLTPP